MSDKSLGYLLVTLQFVLIALIVFLPTTASWSLPLWGVIVAAIALAAGLGITVAALVGLGSSLTAHPMPKKHAELKTGGLYGLVRHPIYSGILLGTFAFVAWRGSWWSLAFAVCLAALFAVKSRFEERMLLARYPGYAEYAAHVGRFIPGVGCRRTPAR